MASDVPWNQHIVRCQRFESKCEKLLQTHGLEHSGWDVDSIAVLTKEMYEIYGDNCSVYTPAGHATTVAVQVVTTPDGASLRDVMRNLFKDVVGHQSFTRFVEQYPQLRGCFDEEVSGLVVMKSTQEVYVYVDHCLRRAAADPHLCMLARGFIDNCGPSTFGSTHPLSYVLCTQRFRKHLVPCSDVAYTEPFSVAQRIGLIPEREQLMTCVLEGAAFLASADQQLTLLRVSSLSTCIVTSRTNDVLSELGRIYTQTTSHSVAEFVAMVRAAQSLAVPEWQTLYSLFEKIKEIDCGDLGRGMAKTQIQSAETSVHVPVSAQSVVSADGIFTDLGASADVRANSVESRAEPTADATSPSANLDKNYGSAPGTPHSPLTNEWSTSDWHLPWISSPVRMRKTDPSLLSVSEDGFLQGEFAVSLQETDFRAMVSESTEVESVRVDDSVILRVVAKLENDRYHLFYHATTERVAHRAFSSLNRGDFQERVIQVRGETSRASAASQRVRNLTQSDKLEVSSNKRKRTPSLKVPNGAKGGASRATAADSRKATAKGAPVRSSATGGKDTGGTDEQKCEFCGDDQDYENDRLYVCEADDGSGICKAVSGACHHTCGVKNFGWARKKAPVSYFCATCRVKEASGKQLVKISIESERKTGISLTAAIRSVAPEVGVSESTLRKYMDVPCTQLTTAVRNAVLTFGKGESSESSEGETEETDETREAEKTYETREAEKIEETRETEETQVPESAQNKEDILVPDSENEEDAAGDASRSTIEGNNAKRPAIESHGNDDDLGPPPANKQRVDGSL